MSDMLKDTEVTLDRVEALFKAAFMRAERDKDGDLVIRDEGIRTFIKVDADRSMITFFTVWGLKPQYAHSKKLELVNKANDEKILVRFTVPNPEMLWCDYQFLYEGGITPFNVINSYKWFVKVCRGAVADVLVEMIE